MKTPVLQYPILITIFCFALFSFEANAQEVEPDLSKIKPAATITPQNPSIPLIDYIRRLPGVLVMNQGGVTIIQLRGSTSLLGNSEPLFVVDNHYIGSFSQLKNTVEVNDISNIDLIKGPDAGTRYGIRGSNGALVITTK